MNSNIGNNKKSQVTIFIIVGIILLLSTSIMVYVKNNVTEKQMELIQPQIADVPNFAQPVNNYVLECIKNTMRDGFDELGNKGGYIKNDKLQIIPKNPTKSNALEFIEGVEIKPTYWHYLKSRNDCSKDCQFDSMRPPLFRGENTETVSEEYSIEHQMDDYIEENINNCLKDFDAFKPQGFDINFTGGKETFTKITENDVRILLEMPIEITKDSRSVALEEYYIIIPFNFKKIYDLATNLTNMEIEYGYLEGLTLELLNSFSGIDELKLPPMSKSDFSSNGVFWESQKIQDNVEAMLQTYVPYIKVQDSLNYDRIIVPQGEYSNTVQSLFDLMAIPITGYSTVGVDFNYFANWPIYFDINSKGGIVGPESIYEPLFSFGLQRYNTVYDISYPVMVSIVDPYAFNNRGYTFRFALEANIRNNEIINDSFEALEAINVPFDTMLCDRNKRNSGNITINIIDSVTSKPIDNASVMYTIGDETCIIGTTKNGVLIENFPVAFNGIVVFEHDNYLGKSEILSTRLYENKELEVVKLYKKKELSIDIKKKIIAPRWSFIDDGVDLKENESVFVTLKRINKIGEKDHELVFSYDNVSVIQELIPGNYNVDISFMKEKEFTILPKERCVGGGGLISLLIPKSKTCQTIPSEPMIMESLTNGGYVGNLTISESDVYDNNEMTLFIVSPDLYAIPINDRIIEDLEQITGITLYSTTYKEQLSPVFK